MAYQHITIALNSPQGRYLRNALSDFEPSDAVFDVEYGMVFVDCLELHVTPALLGALHEPGNIADRANCDQQENAQ